MTDTFAGLVILVAIVWLTIGVALSLVMGRRGHSGYSWLVVGTLMGPLAIVLAVDSSGHSEDLRPEEVAGGVAAVRTGRTDVLAGFDGSPESIAAIEAAADLLGDRLGRLTVATVVPYDGGPEHEKVAKAELEGMVAANEAVAGLVSDMEVLHGRPAEALREAAAAGGYELIAIGARGAGVSKRLLGSAAFDLARGGKVPVLVVGER